jgi:hypothetical protein
MCHWLLHANSHMCSLVGRVALEGISLLCRAAVLCYWGKIALATWNIHMYTS